MYRECGICILYLQSISAARTLSKQKGLFSLETAELARGGKAFAFILKYLISNNIAWKRSWQILRIYIFLITSWFEFAFLTLENISSNIFWCFENKFWIRLIKIWFAFSSPDLKNISNNIFRYFGIYFMNENNQDLICISSSDLEK